jgi:hypothetical protein
VPQRPSQVGAAPPNACQGDHQGKNVLGGAHQLHVAARSDSGQGTLDEAVTDPPIALFVVHSNEPTRCRGIDEHRCADILP